MTRVLIVAPAWIGDMVMAQSLVADLKVRDPEGAVDLMAPPWTAPLGERMPGVRRSLVIDQAHGRLDLTHRLAFGRGLRGEYDLALVLPRSLKSALAPFAAGVRRRRGYLGEMRYLLLNEPRRLDKERLPRTVDQFTALAGPDGETPTVRPPVLTADPAAARGLAERFGLDLARPVIALCPGAEYGPAKQWPSELVAALGRRLVEEGHDIWIFGSPKEQALGEDLLARMAAENGRAVTFAGRTKLLESLDLLSLAAGVVSNDSGLMHVAAALGRPVVGIYGSTSPGVTPPLGRHVEIAQRELECRPCFKRTCPLGHLDCLAKLSPAQVHDQLMAVMAAASADGESLV